MRSSADSFRHSKNLAQEVHVLLPFVVKSWGTDDSVCYRRPFHYFNFFRKHDKVQGNRIIYQIIKNNNNIALCMCIRKGTAHDPKHTTSCIKHGGGSVMA